ncbi:MAG: 5'-deoxynucleotidase [Clostridiales bacterium]|nr:5'-deoxynucleotidase [Clostridiales bacterium]
MSNHFFAMMSRMKNIKRWALMRNSFSENISEHSLEVAMIAQGIAIIGNSRFGRGYNVERCAIIAMYHDCSEIITGDMPTPVKYYNDDIKNIYHEIEDRANEKLIGMLPEDMREYYRDYFFIKEGDEALWKVVKAADKISALIKCIEEGIAGNREFEKAAETTLQTVKAIDLPEVQVFMDEFIDSYSLTLDELKI